MAGEIFISYRRADEAHARLLHERLKAHGVEAWYDAQVGAGEDWRSTTAQALERARIFVLLFSKTAAASDDIAKELAAATLEKKLVVPVRLENIQPKGAFLYELASRNWINAFENTEEKLEELARSLAVLVKSGKLDPTMLPFDRNAGAEKKKAKPPSRIGLVLAGAALALVAAAGVGAYLLKPGGDGSAATGTPGNAASASGKISQRIAFFGFDAADGADARLAELARGTTDELFQDLNAERLDAVARTETLGTDQNMRLERAAQLGAGYALSGDVREEGASPDKRSTILTIRLVDVPSRTVIWEEPISAKRNGAHEPFLQARTSVMAAVALRCAVRYRASLPHEDLEAVRLILQICRDSVLALPPNQATWRKLLPLAEGSQLIRAQYLSTHQVNRGRLTTTTQEALERGASKEADAIAALNPNTANAYLARFEASRWALEPLAEHERLLREGLAIAPDDGALNFWYSYLMTAVGRNQEALSYAQAALSDDPLRPSFHLQMARLQVNMGRGELAGDSYRLGYARAPTELTWYAWMSNALIAGAGDPREVIKLAPEDMNPAVVACWSALIGPAASKDPAVRRGGLNTLMECTQRNFQNVAPGTIGVLAAAFDAGNALFQAAPDPAAIKYGSGNMTQTFLPALRGIRAGPSFIPYSEAMRLMAYWRDTKRFPDFCQQEEAPVCEAMGSPKPTGAPFIATTLPQK